MKERNNLSDIEYVKECLIELYLNVRVRTEQERQCNNNDDDYQKEKARMMSRQDINLVELMIDILACIKVHMNMKAEEVFEKFNLRNLCRICQERYS